MKHADACPCMTTLLCVRFMFIHFMQTLQNHYNIVYQGWAEHRGRVIMTPASYSRGNWLKSLSEDQLS